MDEYGGTAGAVTIEDLFEEVIGDIEENPHTTKQLISREENGALIVAGTVRLDEIGEELDVILQHEEVDTVSGLILTMLERPAQVGDVVIYDEVRFEVLEVENFGAKQCRVTLDATL